jgi:hypothetical protein
VVRGARFRRPAQFRHPAPFRHPCERRIQELPHDNSTSSKRYHLDPRVRGDDEVWFGALNSFVSLYSAVLLNSVIPAKAGIQVYLRGA